jgi:hypothetical protein
MGSARSGATGQRGNWRQRVLAGVDDGDPDCDSVAACARQSLVLRNHTSRYPETRPYIRLLDTTFRPYCARPPRLSRASLYLFLYRDQERAPTYRRNTDGDLGNIEACWAGTTIHVALISRVTT